MKKYDAIVYIGKFSPFHDGHLETLKLALSKAKQVIMVIGSANSARTPKVPWSVEDRKELIEWACIDSGIAQRGKAEAYYTGIHYVFAEDRLYNENKWIQYIQSKVDAITMSSTNIAIIGHEKDSSSYYLKQNFPLWDFVETGPYVKEQSGKVVSATKIRELMFEGHIGYTENHLSPTVYRFLADYQETNHFSKLQQEYSSIINEEKLIEHLPYGMTFVTADSLVTQSGHILLVKRGTYPGKGLWALPGVHVGHNETVKEASLRALVDETHLKVPTKVLKGSLKGMHLFDHPNRSLRARLTKSKARTLTHAYHYELDSSQPLPKNVRGGEGIEEAWWFTFSEVYKMRSELFEDHPDIIDYFIG